MLEKQYEFTTTNVDTISDKYELELYEQFYDENLKSLFEKVKLKESTYSTQCKRLKSLSTIQQHDIHTLKNRLKALHDEEISLIDIYYNEKNTLVGIGTVLQNARLDFSQEYQQELSTQLETEVGLLPKILDNLQQLHIQKYNYTLQYMKLDIILTNPSEYLPNNTDLQPYHKYSNYLVESMQSYERCKNQYLDIVMGCEETFHQYKPYNDFL
jgi:hypothetical protein